MASQEFQPVAFNDGEPLDLDKLSQLSNNITATYVKANSIYSALQNGQKNNAASIPIVDGGTVSFASGLKKGNSNTRPIAFNSSFAGATPIVVATITSSMATPAYVYVTADANNKYTIIVDSTAAVSSAVNVSWIAYAPRIIAI